MPSYVRAGIRKCARIRALSKELRMPQNINALLLCFAEQYEVMKNGIIQTGRFGLDGKV